MADTAGTPLRSEMESKNESSTKTLPFWFHILIFLLAVLVVISRRPDAVTHPQFWAEDGALWYAQANNLGWWKALLRPEAGYFCTLPRIAAGFAQWLPLRAAPLVFNLIAIVFQVLPVSFFLSSRLASAEALRSRMLLAFLYLALPNSFEVNANITNAQWHLALLALLVVEASPAMSWLGRCFDFVVIILSALTGPFAILLLPFAAIAWGWRRRERSTLALLVTLVLGALVQIGALVRTGAAARMQGSLGATPLLLAKILSSQVFLAALIGKNNLPYRHSYTVYAVLIAIAGTAAFLYALWRAGWELKLFIMFANLVLMASLLHPMAHEPQWLELLGAWGVRYWFLPMLAFVAVLVWMAGGSGQRAMRFIAVAALVLMSVGIAREWRYAPYADLNFGGYARQFSELPKGESLTIPLNPQGWSMTLEKR